MRNVLHSKVIQNKRLQELRMKLLLVGGYESDASEVEFTP